MLYCHVIQAVFLVNFQVSLTDKHLLGSANVGWQTFAYRTREQKLIKNEYMMIP